MALMSFMNGEKSPLIKSFPRHLISFSVAFKTIGLKVMEELLGGVMVTMSLSLSLKLPWTLVMKGFQ